MSSAEAQAPADHAAADHAPADHHPTPRDYVRIGVVLAVLTALEILTSYILIPRWMMMSGLIGMAVLKFALVVSWYMHLKFDSKLFKRLFAFGLILAVSTFLVVLGLFALKTTDSTTSQALAPPASRGGGLA